MRMHRRDAHTLLMRYKAQTHNVIASLFVNTYWCSSEIVSVVGMRGGRQSKVCVGEQALIVSHVYDAVEFKPVERWMLFRI